MPRTSDGEPFVIDRSAFLNNTYSAFLHENIVLEDRAANKFINKWKQGPGLECKPPWSASQNGRSDRETLMVANSQRPYLATPMYSSGYLRPQYASNHAPTKRIRLQKLNSVRPASSTGEVNVLDLQHEKRKELLCFGAKHIAKKEFLRRYVGDQVIRSTLRKLKHHISSKQR